MVGQRGFTLTELLVVIAIVGILASIALWSVNNTHIRARDAQRQKDIETLQGAIEQYFADNGHYPVGAAGSDRACWKNPVNSQYTDTVCNPLYVLVASKEMDSLPYDPGANGYVGTGCGGAQFYAYWSDGAKYLLGAVREAQGSVGCTSVGNWEGPTPASTYAYQLYARNF